MYLRKKNRAFTLIELMFALLLIGLITRVSLPQFNTIFRINLKSGAARIAAYFHASYQRSIMRHQHIRVSFDVESGKFWAETYKPYEPEPFWNATTNLDDAMSNAQKKLDDQRDPDTSTIKFEKVESEDLQMDALPKGVKIKGIVLLQDQKESLGNVQYIDFLPSGFASAAIVYVTNDYNDVFSVILYPVGGRVDVQKGEITPSEV